MAAFVLYITTGKSRDLFLRRGFEKAACFLSNFRPQDDQKSDRWEARWTIKKREVGVRSRLADAELFCNPNGNGGVGEDGSLEFISASFIGSFRATSPQIDLLLDALITVEKTHVLDDKCLRRSVLPRYTFKVRPFPASAPTAETCLIGLDCTSIDALEHRRLTETGEDHREIRPIVW